MISVELSGVTTMPLGNSRSPATWRDLPSGVTNTMIPASGGFTGKVSQRRCS